MVKFVTLPLISLMKYYTKSHTSNSYTLFSAVVLNLISAAVVTQTEKVAYYC